MPVREDRVEPASGIFFTPVVLKKSYAGEFKIFFFINLKQKIKKPSIYFSNNSGIDYLLDEHIIIKGFTCSKRCSSS